MKRTVDLDKVGAVASAICAVHCVITGLALGLLSIAGLGFVGSPAAEFGFLAVAVIVGVWAVVHGVRKHHSYIPASIFVLGLMCVVGSHFLFEHGDAGGGLLSAVGGVCLVAFHVVNLRLQRRCSCGHCKTGR